MSSKWKSVLIFLVLVVVVAGAAFIYNRLSPSLTPETPTEQDMVPTIDFTVLDNNGNDVSLSDFKGKPVVVNFWATWCGYCKQEMPDFEAAYKDHPDVQFMMINATDGMRETVEIADKYIQEEDYTFPVFYDVNSAAVTMFSVRAFPCTYFLNAEGEVVAYQNGMLSRDMLEEGIRRITK